MQNYDVQSEEYILYEEECSRVWLQRYGSLYEKILALANKCLATKSKEYINGLIDFFDRRDIVEEFTQKTEFAFIVVMMEIYDNEIKAGVDHNIFEWAYDLDGVIRIIRRLKFYLWEIEFLETSESENLLVEFLQENNISIQALQCVIQIACSEKEKVLCRVLRCLGK